MAKTRLLALTVIVVVLSSAYGAIVDLSWLPTGWRIVAILLAAIGVSYLLLFRELPNLDRNAPGKPIACTPSQDEIEQAAGYVGLKYSKAAIDSFLHLLIDLPVHLSRVDEEVEEILGRTLTVRTRLQYRMDMSCQKLASTDKVNGADVSSSTAGMNQPPAASSPPNAEEPDINDVNGKDGKTLLVPIISARKGQLFDRLMVNGPSGGKVPVLSQWEVWGLMWCAIATLFEFAQSRTLSKSANASVSQGTPTHLTKHDEEIMNDLITNAVCHVGGVRRLKNKTSSSRRRYLRWARRSKQPEPLDSNHLTERDNALKKVGQLTFDPYWQDLIKQVCEMLASNYFLVAEVVKPDGVNLSVSYSCHYSPESMHMASYEQGRAKRGLYPCVIDIPMTRAFQSDSYHFELLAPSGQYVFSHELANRGTNEAAKQEEFKVSGVQQYVRIYHEEGRSVAHTYIRRQGRPKSILETMQPPGAKSGASRAPSIPSAPDLKSVIRLREIPPGSLGSICILATLTALIILFFTLSRAGLDGSSSVGGAPALILAIPAFVASALGRGIDSERIGRSSLVSYFSLLCVGTLSFSAAMLYVWSASHAGTSRPDSLSLIGGQVTLSVDIPWLVLSIAAIGLVAFVWRERNNQTGYYLAIRRRMALDQLHRYAYNRKTI